MNDNEKLISCILDLGEILLVSGAEVSRIEDTIARLCKAYGFTRTDIFTIPSSIILTVKTEEGGTVTQTRRIKVYETDLERVEKVNALSRELCRSPMETVELEGRIADIRQNPKYGLRILYPAYALTAAVFTMFYGGNIWDAAASAGCAVLIYFLLRLGSKIELHSMILTISCAALGGVTAVILTRSGLGSSVNSIILGNIMLMIPGLALTTSLRDLISGDIISGLLGLCTAVLKAIAIAVGFACVLVPLGI